MLPGPVIRIAPRHVSIAIPEALGTVYGHGNGALKADFYDAVSTLIFSFSVLQFITFSLFLSDAVSSTHATALNTRESARLSLIFSPKRVCSSLNLKFNFMLPSCLADGTRSLTLDRAHRVAMGKDGTTRMVGSGLTFYLG
jgi:hypothetical protein